jgi:hypothetical protein
VADDYETMMLKPDKYIKTHEPVYRYQYFGNANVDPGNPPVPGAAPGTFNMELNFGSAATLDPHRTWMIAIESFVITAEQADMPEGGVSLLMGNCGQTQDKSNVRSFDGGSLLFPFDSTVQAPSVVSNTGFGRVITNPHFLNSNIPCQLRTTKFPSVVFNDATGIQVTFVVYAYEG